MRIHNTAQARYYKFGTSCFCLEVKYVTFWFPVLPAHPANHQPTTLVEDSTAVLAAGAPTPTATVAPPDNVDENIYCLTALNF